MLNELGDLLQQGRYGGCHRCLCAAATTWRYCTWYFCKLRKGTRRNVVEKTSRISGRARLQCTVRANGDNRPCEDPNLPKKRLTKRDVLRTGDRSPAFESLTTQASNYT